MPDPSPVPQERQEAFNRARDAVRARVDATRSAPPPSRKSSEPKPHYARRTDDPEFQAELSRWYEEETRKKSSSTSTPVPPKATPKPKTPDQIRANDPLPHEAPHDPKPVKMTPREHPGELLHPIRHSAEKVRQSMNLSIAATPWAAAAQPAADLPRGWINAGTNDLLITWNGDTYRVARDGEIVAGRSVPDDARPLTSDELVLELMARALSDDTSPAPAGSGGGSGSISTPTGTDGTDSGTTTTTTTTGPSKGFDGSFMANIHALLAGGAPAGYRQPSPPVFHKIGDSLVVTSGVDRRAINRNGALAPLPSTRPTAAQRIPTELAAAELASRFLTPASASADGGVRTVEAESRIEDMFADDDTLAVQVDYYVETKKQMVIASVVFEDGTQTCYQFVQDLTGPAPLLGWRVVKCPALKDLMWVDPAQAEAYARAQYAQYVEATRDAERQRTLDEHNSTTPRRPGHHRPSGGGAARESGYEFSQAFGKSTWSRGTSGPSGEFGGEGATGTSFSAMSKRTYETELPAKLGHLSAGLTASAWRAGTTSPTPRGGIEALPVAPLTEIPPEVIARLLDIAAEIKEFLAGTGTASVESAASRQIALRSEVRRLVGDDQRVGRFLSLVADARLREPGLTGGQAHRVAWTTQAQIRAVLAARTAALLRVAEVNQALVASGAPSRDGQALIWRGTRPGVAGDAA